MKEHFEKFLGLGNVSDNENDLHAYGYDGSELQGRARLVMWPEQYEQLRLILTYCNRNSLDVVIRGNGTNSTGMTIPNNSLVVSMQGFDRIHSLNIGEKWVFVDAGVTVHELNTALAEHGLQYPLVSENKLMTIGSSLAINGACRYSHKYGLPASRVIELEVMDGTGKLFTVKEPSDYIGLEGTTFIILKAKLKLIEITERSADVQYFDTAHEAIEYAQSVEGALSVEYLDEAAATYGGFNTKHTIIVEWEGEKGNQRFENYAQTIQKLANLRKMLGIQGYILIEDCTLDKNRVEEGIEWCRNNGLPIIAHAALGVVHPYLKRSQSSLREQWYAWLEQRNQNHAGEFGYGLLKKKYVPMPLRNRLRTMKERYDYNNILGRGKIYDYV